MPRPEFSARRTGPGAKVASSNPFVAWIQGRKERRQQAQEQASRMITNQIAQNESTIIDQLSSIDFLHSKLPDSVLKQKSRPNQPCCDLEYACRGIVHTLLANPQTIKIDIRKIDEKMLTLVMLLKQAVEQGDSRAAYAAKGALVRAVMDIRSRIPQEQPELAKQFVELNAKYLEEWITLVSLAQVADRTKQNVDAQRALNNTEKEKHANAISALAEQIEKDPSYSKAFFEIHENDTPEARVSWTEEQKELHKMMIELRMKRVNLALSDQMLHQRELDLSMKEAQVEALNTKVAGVPIVADPNLMNKFQEDINELFDQLAASDAEIDEMLKTMDDFEGRIAQLNNAPGAIRAREIAAEEAEAVVQEIQRRQAVESGELVSKTPEYLKKLGILSTEELMERQRELQEAQLRAEEELNQTLELHEQNEQVLYN